jgi:hypothetical protein
MKLTKMRIFLENSIKQKSIFKESVHLKMEKIEGKKPKKLFY